MSSTFFKLEKAEKALIELEKRKKGLEDKISREQRSPSRSENNMLKGFEESIKLHKMDVARIKAETEIEVSMEKAGLYETCPNCGGTGLEGYRTRDRCTWCQGDGRILKE